MREMWGDHLMLNMRRRVAASVASAGLAVFGFGSFDLALAGNTAVITGSFSADCTDFTATSDKDLGNVVINYADGSTEKVDTFSDPKSYTLTGDKSVASAHVKSGATTESFPCTPTTDPRTVDPCAYDGAVGLVTGNNEWTLARAGHYVVEGLPLPVVYPRANGPVSGELEAAEAPEPVKRGTHEAACAVSLVDGH